MIFLGIDNGVTGSIGIIGENSVNYIPMPVKRVLNYTKTKKWLHRIDCKKLRHIIHIAHMPNEEIFATIERPMVNPGRFQATISAIRALESVLNVLEDMEVAYQYIDSKEWQKAMLPKDLEKEELKEASLQVAKRLFPKIDFGKMKDADGLLIAAYVKKTHEKNN